MIRLIIGYKVGTILGVDIKLDRKYGLILSTIAALGLVGGGFLKFQEDGGELPSKKNGGSGENPSSPF